MNYRQKTAHQIKEHQRLANVARRFSTDIGFNSTLIELRYRTLRKYFRGETCLELGSSDGKGTQHLLDYFDRVVAVDGSRKFTEDLKGRFPSKNLEVIRSLFEEYQTTEKFDVIVLAHVLEHVKHPVAVLRCAKRWLKRSGVLLVDVPNANSIHRLVGVKMGLLKSITSLNEGDIRIGHRRVYTISALEQDIQTAGLRVKKIGGVFLKPVSNTQIEKTWSPEMVEGFYELGQDIPELASEIYAVCTL